MKFRASIITAFIVSNLGACTTVDLSQVALKQPQIIETPAQNVVERASASLTELFRQEGWSKAGPTEMTNRATRVLLGGLEVKEDSAADPVLLPRKTVVVPGKALLENLAQLDADISKANTQIRQTSKAAEVFLTIADDHAKLDRELSMLEKALLSAREAETRFAQPVARFDDAQLKRDLVTLSESVDRLKHVTDAYGDRIRSQITARARASKS